MSDETPVPGELAIGEHLAGYRLDEIIARGGMAVVYRAFDERLGRSVALKVLAAPLARDEAFRRRFVRESRAAAAVDHPNIVPIYDAGEADGVLYIAMRLVPGHDVLSLIEQHGPMPVARVCQIVTQVAAALDAAHEQGLVHRGAQLIVADSNRDNAPGRGANLAVIDVQRALHRQPALTGFLRTGSTPGSSRWSRAVAGCSWSIPAPGRCRP